MNGRTWADTPLETATPSNPEVEADHDQDDLIDELWQRAETLVLPMREGAALTDDEGRLALLQPSELDAIQSRAGATTGDGEPHESLRLYLGRVTPGEGLPGDGILTVDGTGRIPVIAIMLAEEIARHVSKGSWAELRSLSGNLDPKDLGLLTRATALANWHSRSQFSPVTGRPTRISRSGWVRVDEADGSEHFPRTDPAVIVAVSDDQDRLLLGSNTAWEQNRFSLIAGFVDAGESLEAAVVREVREETGLAVVKPRYLGSQPWPFPASLMIGFSARVVDQPGRNINEPMPDGREIRELRWFSRTALSQAIDSGDIMIPMRGSISRSIIEAWYGEKILMPNGEI